MQAGLESFTVLTPLDILFRYLLIGWDIKPLGIPREVDGVKQAAVSVKVNQAALSAVREAFAIDGSIVSYLGPAPAQGTLIDIHPGIERERVALN